MRVPRDLSGADRVKRLRRFGYSVTHGEHHITIPNHDPLKLGTLASILAGVAVHHGLARDELIQRLFEWETPPLIQKARLQRRPAQYPGRRL